ncbi:hypothetical protein D3C71_1256210 [compost metagenome]
MIVGSTWKAKMKPYLGTSIRLPKMKLEPSLTKLRILTKPLPSQSNTSRPPGTSSTSAAKAICSVIPVATSFQSTAFLLFENSQVMPKSTARPKRPKPILPKPSTMMNPRASPQKTQA